MEINPIDIFRKWFGEEPNLSKVRVPTACCFSTIGIDNFRLCCSSPDNTPNAAVGVSHQPHYCSTPA
jgi:hypothetical protein